MTKSFRRNVCLLAGVLSLCVSLPVTAEVVYDNSVNDNGRRFVPGTSEVADQIVLSSPGYLTNFSFEYFADNTGAGLQGTVEGRVQFYRIDGGTYNGYTTPGSVFYDSGWFSIPGMTPRSTMNFTAGQDFAPTGLFIPTTQMAWSIQFRGMAGTDVVGVDVFSPPVIGQNYPDYWLRVGNSWELKQDAGGFPIDFAARFEANIPEPSAVSLLILGAGTFIAMRRNRR